MRARLGIQRGAGAITVTLGLTLLAPAQPAEAAGMITHAWMAESAIPLVDDGALQSLLLANADQVEAGATFPDTGYVGSNTFGEEAHWQRFVDAYAARILARDDCGPLTAPTGPCAPMIAHLLGVAAHGMGDQVWDWLFEPNSPDLGEYYVHPDFGSFAGVDGQELQMDLVAVGEHGRPRPAIPALPSTSDLLAAFEASGLTGVTASQFALIAVPQVAWDAYQVWIPLHLEALEAAMPWMSANMVTAPGGVGFAAVAIAGYWDSLWAELLGGNPPTTVSITYPADGQRRIPATGWVRTYQPGSSPGRGGARTRITAVLTEALPYVPATGGPNPSANLPAGSMTLVERDTGTPVPILDGYPRAVPYDPSAGEHMVDVQPAVDLQPCTWYEASVTGILVDADQAPVTPHPWSFRTGTDADGSRCADDPLLGDETNLSGTVRDPGGMAVAGVTVMAYAPSDGLLPSATAFTGPDGSYRLADLPPGTYRLRFAPPAGSGLVATWSGGTASRLAALDVVVSAGATVTHDAHLVAPTSIAGRVTGPDGDGLPGVAVRAFTQGNVWLPEGTTVTAADGTFTLDGLAPATYSILFRPPVATGLVARWYHGAASPASSVPVVAGAHPVTGIDEQFSAPGSMSGAVTGPDGAGVAGVRVVLYRPSSRYVGAHEAITGTDGTYRLSGLDVGTYKIRFVPPTASGLAAQWYDDATTRTTATPVVLYSGAGAAVASDQLRHNA